ncbi:MAG: ECF transporter S component [Ruminococcaceae bacterium]|nr:ECF transporter S component [Oscillospiraceae bacterium]
MVKLIEQFKENIAFVLVCVAIAAVLSVGAKLAEKKLALRSVSPARRLCILAVCGAIAAVLHIFDFPLPFLAPGFYKLDFSEVPVMLCGFYLGPSATVLCEALKILLKLVLKGTSTAFVGDFANFFVGCSLVLPATVIYHGKKSRKSALIGLFSGTIVLTVFGSAFNGIYLIPKFSDLYGIPLEAIIGMGTAINGSIDSITTLVLLSVAPLNLLKGIIVSLLTVLLYKKVARPLFEK